MLLDWSFRVYAGKAFSVQNFMNLNRSANPIKIENALENLVEQKKLKKVGILYQSKKQFELKDYILSHFSTPFDVLQPNQISHYGVPFRTIEKAATELIEEGKLEKNPYFPSQLRLVIK